MNKTLASIITAAGLAIGSSAYLPSCHNNPVQTGGSESSHFYSRKSQADCEFAKIAQILSCYEKVIADIKKCADNLRAPLGAYDNRLNEVCVDKLDAGIDEETRLCVLYADDQYYWCERGEQK